MKKILYLAVAAIMITSVTFAQTNVKKSFTGIKTIKLRTSSGNCEIKKASGSSVELDLNYTFEKGEYEPRIEQSGDRLDLGEEFRGHNHNGSARWTLSIPDGLSIRFSTGSGDFIVSNVSVSRIDASTGSGNLEFKDVKGEIDATTGSGDVDVDKLSGIVKINTGSGNMTVYDGEGDLDLNCGSGNIRITSIKAAFSINTGSGSINADKVTITGSSRFNTGSGRAKVGLAATPKNNISVNSGSGDAELNFNGNEIVGEITMKASKRYGNISAPFDFDKTEEIDQYNKDNVTIVKTAVKGNASTKISVSTGSGDAVLKK